MDQTIFYFFYNFAHQSVLCDRVIIFFANTFPYIVTLAAILFLFIHHDMLRSKSPVAEFLRKWKEIVFVFFSGGIAWLLATILKLIVRTPRPFTIFANVQPLFPEPTFAFPSQHTVFFAAVGISIFLIHKKAGVLFIVFALMIGVARVMAGVHFPIDILGGFIIGGLISFVLHKIYYKKI